MADASVLEWAEPGDQYRDYCLWDYAPQAATQGKLRSASLLWHSFDTLDKSGRLRAMVEAVRAAIGPFETVWGVKESGGTFSWELYFYDYRRFDRRVSIERVLDALRPFAASALTLSRTRPYFMFSLDLDAALGAGRRGIEDISVYMGNPSAGVSSGICYNYSAEGLRLDNLYYFFDRRSDWDAAVGKITCSAHLDLDRIVLSELLWPELRDCAVIVAANKRFGDGVYFSRIRIDQLIFFAARMNYPAAIQRFLCDNRGLLDHLFFDVGLDYRMVDGRLEFTKSAYYGLV
ncbi:MAG: hypothetical protein INR68_00465 [Methylobacterium mesophilicum]|nr:hypothetical protein [Methylobacterium mesophilicum]